MRTEKLRGLWVASLTPLAADGRIDMGLFASHCRWLFSRGVDGVAVFGTTGEGQSFSVRERIDAVDSLLRAGIPGDRIVVGTGCAAVPDAVELTRHALASDVAAAMILPPFFWKGQDDAAVAHGIGSVIAGVLWDRAGTAAPFWFGAGGALAAVLLAAVMRPRSAAADAGA